MRNIKDCLSNIVPEGVSRFFDNLAKGKEDEENFHSKREEFLNALDPSKKPALQAYVHIEAARIGFADDEFSFDKLAEIYCADERFMLPHGGALDVDIKECVTVEDVKDFIASLSPEHKKIVDGIAQRDEMLQRAQALESPFSYIGHMR